MSSSALVVMWSAAVAVLAGCKTTGSADNRSTAREENPPVLTSARAPSTPPSPVVPSAAVKAQMRGHDAHAAALRDAVARADLAVAKREATALADVPIDRGDAPAWNARLDAMKIAAGNLAAAGDLTGASRELAVLARTCGDCHGSLGGGPKANVTEPPESAPGVDPRMDRHRWAVDRLWEGLTVPSEHAWKMGARVLMDAPLQPELLTPGQSPVPEIGSLATSVHDLGRRARVTEAAVDRGAIYGDLMTTCSACHARLGGGPSPGSRR